LSGDITPGVGTGASSTLPSASVCTMNGPNSSPNHMVPSRPIRTDSMSKSPPVSSRSGVPSLTIGNGTLRSGSWSVIASSTVTVPGPPRAVSKLGRTRYTRSRNEREFALLPKPLSGIAQNRPLPASSSAEKPPIGWVEPGAGAGSVFGTPGNGAGQVASAGRIARASSVGSRASAEPASASAAATPMMSPRMKPPIR
jgi:hypothetical protein